MKHTQALGSTLNNRNGFYFEIGLRSSASSRLAGYDDEIWFDGTDSLATADSLSEQLLSNMRVEQNQSSYLYSYYDEGDILIRYPSEGNENRNLVGGGYTTNIYIHLVCEQ